MEPKRCKYKWGNTYEYGWGRIDPGNNNSVNIICESGGIGNSHISDVTFIEHYTNPKQEKSIKQ